MIDDRLFIEKTFDTVVGLAASKGRLMAVNEVLQSQLADEQAKARAASGHGTANLDAVKRLLEFYGPPGDKIGAIKAVREATGCGLKEAKDVVEAASFSVPPAHTLAPK